MHMGVNSVSVFSGEVGREGLCNYIYVIVWRE